MNRTKLFQFCVFVLSLLSILSLITCEKDPTSPIDNEPQTTATIGADGGKLETADFTLEIPAGSFTETVTLNLSISSEASSFGESSVSQTFKVEGLPDEFDKSLRIAIKYNGDLSDSSYIAVGKMTEGYITGDSSVVYHYISIKDSSGFLVGNLLGNSGQGANKIADISDDIVNPWTWFIGATGQKEYKSDHFNFKYPNIYGSTTIQTLANEFEETLSKLIEEFNFKFPDWWWHLDVIFESNSYGHTWDKDDKGFAFINFAESLLPQSQSVNNQINISKVFMSLAIMNNLDEANGGAVIGHWIGMSVFIYISNYLNIPESHYPTELSGNELIPFDGLNKANPTEIKKRSGGMQSWFKYMVKTEKIAKTKIVDYICLYNICSNNKLLTNFINAVPNFIADWWPDYFEKLIIGELYNINSSVFLNSENLGGTWNISSDEDSESFLKNYPDLSAKRFIVNLKNTNFDENANLYLDATGNSGYDGVATIVFGVNSSNILQHLVTAKNDPAMIPNLKQYYDNGIRQFLVVVVNSMHNGTDYLGNSDIELNMEVKVEVNDYNYCSVSVRTNYDIHDDGTLWGENDFSTDRTIYHGYNGNLVNGIFTGTAYPTDEFGNTYTGSINVNLNGSVNSFSMELTENKFIENSQLYWGKNVIEVGNYKIQGGSGIQSISDSQYKVEGSTTCSHLTENNFTRYLEIINPYSGTLENTVNESSTNSYSCNGGSYISITFSKQ